MNTDAPTEHHFEDRLLAAILADFDDLTATPAGPSRLRRNRHARPAFTIPRTVPALIAGAAAVALGVVGVTALGGHVPSGRSRGAVPALTHPKVHTAAYVVDHMQAALNADTAVLKILDHAPDSQTGKPVFDEIWSTSKGHTTRFEDLDPSSKPTDGYVVTVTPNRTISIAINYQDHTWSKTTYPFGSASSSSGPAPRHSTPEQSAAQLRADVAAGKVTLVGPATVDGQDAIELKEVSAHGLLDMWVDPTTYLPIRTIGTAPGMSQTSDQAIRDDYTWLPGTPANLRLVTAAAAIPAGFTQVGTGSPANAHQNG